MRIDKRVYGLTLTLFVAMAACTNEPSKLVVIDYDQVNNFKTYEFQSAFSVANPDSVSVSQIHAGDQSTSGVWMTFLICGIRNTESNAQPFNYDVSKFFVDFGGKRHFAATLPPDTFEYSGSFSNLPGIASTAPDIYKALRKETQLGEDTHLFVAHQEEFPLYRFAIYVSQRYGSAPPITGEERLTLGYDSNHPHLLNPRNQEPVVRAGELVTRRTDLLDTCRPPVK